MTARNRRSSPAQQRNEAAILRALEAGPMMPERLFCAIGASRANGRGSFECLIQGMIYSGRVLCRGDGRLMVGRRGA